MTRVIEVQQASCPEDMETQRAGCAAYPPGSIWSAVDRPGTYMFGLNKAWTALLNMVNKAACEILLEFRCYSADKTIDEWMKDYGLPDDCGINDLCAKVTAQGDGSCEHLIDVGAKLGYELCCQEPPDAPMAGCWGQLGYTRLGPPTVQLYGGSMLGYAMLGCHRPDESGGSTLGDAPLGPGGCHISGYHTSQGTAAAEAQTKCDDDGFEPYQRRAWGSFCCLGQPGREAEYVYEDRAHHFMIGTPDGPIGGAERARCEAAPPIGSQSWELGISTLGKYKPGVYVKQEFAMVGHMEIGCQMLCAPQHPALCFVGLYKHAHTKVIPYYC